MDKYKSLQWALLTHFLLVASPDYHHCSPNSICGAEVVHFSPNISSQHLKYAFVFDHKNEWDVHKKRQYCLILPKALRKIERKSRLEIRHSDCKVIQLATKTLSKQL